MTDNTKNSKPSGTACEVSKLPPCNFCDPTNPNDPNNVTTPAKYDFKTIYGYWAYGCTSCYKAFRYFDELGTGKGQLLIVATDTDTATTQGD